MGIEWMRMKNWFRSYLPNHRFRVTSRTHVLAKSAAKLTFANAEFLELLVVSIASVKRVQTVKIRLNENFSPLTSEQLGNIILNAVCSYDHILISDTATS